MTTYTITVTATRPSPAVPFFDPTNADLAAYGKLLSALPGSQPGTVSADNLTWTHVMVFDDATYAEFQSLSTAYQSTIAVEVARKQANGITTTKTVVPA